MLKGYFLLLFFAAFLALASVFIEPSFAAVTCTTQYGGAQTCVATGQFLVNKKVLNPVTGAFVDNLTADVHQFRSGDAVTFSVDIKNTGDATLNNVQFTDTLPPGLVWTGGDPLSSQINSLTPGQTVTKTINARVVSGATGCQLNTATASAAGMTDSDTAQVCFVTVVPVVPKVTPPTGPEDWALVLSAPAWLGGIGWYLKKISLKGVKK